jgi:hypothetical protein
MNKFNLIAAILAAIVGSQLVCAQKPAFMERFPLLMADKGDKAAFKDIQEELNGGLAEFENYNPKDSYEETALKEFLRFMKRLKAICEVNEVEEKMKEECDQKRNEIKYFMSNLDVEELFNVKTYIDECSKRQAEVCGWSD